MRWKITMGFGLALVGGCSAAPVERCEPSMEKTRVQLDGGSVCVGDGPCAPLTVLQAGAPDPRRGLSLVFIAEGFTAGELPRFRRSVSGLLADMGRDADSLVGRAGPHVNAYTIELESPTNDTTNAAPHDTALGACLAADALNPAGLELLTTAERDLAARVAGPLVPHADAIVVLINSAYGRANASYDGLIFIGLDHDAATLTHELGHAVLGLGDEYTDTPEAFDGGLGGFAFWYPGPADVREPNLSLDPTGAKWRHIVPSAVEGGARRKTGVYHPAERCRMNRPSDPFCPVCAAEAAAFVLPFSGGNDGPPRCHLESTRSLTPFDAPLGFLEVPCTDANGLEAMTVWLDDRPVWDLAPFLAAPWVDPTGKRRTWVAQVAIGFEPIMPGSTPLDAGRHVVRVSARDTMGQAASFEHAFEAGGR